MLTFISMKILLVSGPGISLKEPFNSGIESFMNLFAEQLCEDGHTVDVVAAEAKSDVKFNVVSLITKSTSIQPLNSLHPQEIIDFKKINLDLYDIVHYNMFYPDIIEAGLACTVPSVLTLHTPTESKRVEVYKKFSQDSHLKLVAISARIQKQWGSALNIDIPLIHNGINIHNWQTAKVRKQDYLLWSARLCKEKNVVDAIRVAQHLNMPLKIAGRITDQYYFDHEVKPHLNNKIEYVGHITQGELNVLAKNSCIYLATATWQEPFGLAALEMLASGIPVVGFNTAVPQEWKHPSVLTTPSLRWQDLIELIKKSTSISIEQCQDFASNMTIQKMTSEYVNFYNKLVSDSKIRDKLSAAKDSFSQIGQA